MSPHKSRDCLYAGSGMLLDRSPWESHDRPAGRLGSGVEGGVPLGGCLGVAVYVWRPSDLAEIEHVLKGAMDA